MIKGFVFDLDHTLFDRYGTLAEVIRNGMYAFSFVSDIHEARIIKTWIEIDKKFVHHGWPRMFNELRRTGIFAYPPPTDDALSRFLIDGFGRHAVKFEFTIPTLKELKRRGFAVALITNGGHELQSKKLEMLELTDCFDEVMISHDFGADKPDKSIFLEMARRLKLDPSELCYVGDNPINDVVGSRSAGYTPIWIRTCGAWPHHNAPLPQYRMDSVAEVLSLDIAKPIN